MQRNTSRRPRSLVTLTAALALAPVALVSAAAAQSPDQKYFEAYYLEHEKADLKAANTLYANIAADRRAPRTLRERAGARAQATAEELASSDFAALMPANSILYAELSRPGAQLSRLLDQLGLLSGGAPGELGISPALLNGLLGLRGAAIAIIEIDPRRGPTDGVLLFHPGHLDVVRGLLETALPIGARSVEPIAGYPTYDIQGQALVTLASKMVIASASRTQIEAVVARMQGRGGSSLASSSARVMKSRGDDLLFVCINVEPILPMLEQVIARQARRDPEILAAMALLDLRSTRYLTAHAGVDDNGLSIEMAVELDEGHRNLVFNLLRMPNLDRESLSMVPAGSAFFAAAALNPRGEGPPAIEDGGGRPAVTMMDFGREIFGNLASVAIYALPKVQRAPWGPMPEVALAMQVNDPARSRALWQLMLGSAQAATGRGSEPVVEHGMAKYEIQGVPVFVGEKGNKIAISPAPAAVAAALAGIGESVVDDPGFAGVVQHFGSGSTVAMAVHAGRCMEIARHFMSKREQREIKRIAPLLAETAVALRIEHTQNRVGALVRVSGIPNVQPMVSELIERELRQRRRLAVAAHAAPSDASKLEELNAAGDVERARQVVAKIHRQSQAEPETLNDLAWNLLTEDRFGGHYDDLALAMSKTSNEASQWGNWYYLDTYAVALFKSGDIAGAIRYERKAIEIGKDSDRIGEAEKQLERFVATQNGGATVRDY